MSFDQIAKQLISWHSAHQRQLPWRNRPAGHRNPYAVWVSEIMAQQTRVETVVAYFVRWMKRFPTVESLAAADQQEVLKAWEGLGYYSRARNLHTAAQIIATEYDGRLPAERTELLRLPGIGEYTAGAILSMAFAQAEPILDGNVKRVLSRLFDIAQPINHRDTLERLWTLARELVRAAPSGEAGLLNESLMELGATLCTPRKPHCLVCPVAQVCLALERGTQHQRPVMPAKKPIPHYDVAAGVIWRSDRYKSPVLIAQRPQNGMLAGLWEFPGGKREANDVDLRDCLRREIREELNGTIEVEEKIAEVAHAYTHFRITLHAFHSRYVSGPLRAIGCAQWKWVTLDSLGDYPFPVTDQKIIRALTE